MKKLVPRWKKTKKSGKGYETVPSHKRRDSSGKWLTVNSFHRKAKPKAHKNLKKDSWETKIIRYRDDQGRLVSKRVRA